MAGFTALALENAYLSSLGSFFDTFELARVQVATMFHARDSVSMQTPVRLLTMDGRPVRLAGGRTLRADAGLEVDVQHDLVHLPAFLVGDEAALDARLANARRLCAWLRGQHAGGALITASGSAVFLLAEAGLLDGGSAAVARPLVPLFRRRYGGIRADPRKAVVEHGRILTSPGFAADTQLIMRAVESCLTPELARWIGDVTGMHQASEQQLAEDDLTANAQLWIEERFAEDLRIAELAKAMSVSQQTLLRHFQRHLGMTPRDYVGKLRMETAQQLLTRTARPIQQIASLVGYNDVHAFAEAFRRFNGMSASQFRSAQKSKR